MILAEAIALYEGKNVVQTQSYGPESRGGASKCEIIISDGEIFYPKVMKLDILLTLTQEALDKNIIRLKKNGILIADSFLVKDIPKPNNPFRLLRHKCMNKSIALPFTQIASQNLGNILVANMIALGTLVGITKLARAESVQEAIKDRINQKFWKLDNKAFNIGLEEAEKIGTDTYFSKGLKATGIKE
jgi:2-oxoglutarate ferredoxin oxidoreductase subunit gamma